MSNFDSSRQELLNLVNLAIEGQLDLDDFDKLWPQGLSSSAAAVKIYADVEDGVEHLPAKFFSKGPDWEMWKRSQMYALLCLDRELLKSGKSERSIKLAHDALSKMRIDPDALSETVSRFMESLGED